MSMKLVTVLLGAGLVLARAGRGFGQLGLGGGFGHRIRLFLAALHDRLGH